MVFLIVMYIVLKGTVQQPDYYSNQDLENVISPIKAHKLEEMLVKFGYPEHKTCFLVDGFVNGFDIGYEGPVVRQSISDNIPFSVGDKIDLWNKLIKEVRLQRVAGPFKDIPFDNYIQSPIGLVPKAGGDQT